MPSVPPAKIVIHAVERPHGIPEAASEVNPNSKSTEDKDDQNDKSGLASCDPFSRSFLSIATGPLIHSLREVGEKGAA